MRETRPLELEHFMGVTPGRGSRFDAVDQHGKTPYSSASNVSTRSPGAEQVVVAEGQGPHDIDRRVKQCWNPVLRHLSRFK